MKKEEGKKWRKKFVFFSCQRSNEKKFPSQCENEAETEDEDEDKWLCYKLFQIWHSSFSVFQLFFFFFKLTFGSLVHREREAVST